MRKYILFITIISWGFLASCDRQETYQTRMEDERAARIDYLAKNGITNDNLEEEAGIYYQVLRIPKEENAPKVEMNDEVAVYYVGYFLNGVVFDSNVLSGKYEPMTIRVVGPYTGQIIRNGAVAGGVITGWVPALLKMKQGTKARVVIPSNRAYGMYGSRGIPGYTTLVFEIEVQEVRKAKK